MNEVYTDVYAKNGIYEDKSKRFVNPYNFVPLMGKCERSQPDLTTEESYTGYFDCSIKLLSHLFIPNTSSASALISKEEKEKQKQMGKKEMEWKGYDFFSYDDLSKQKPNSVWPPMPPKEPIIPGSEIRGAVRSVYEAAFNGCMSTISEDRVFSRRNMQAKVPAILWKEDGKWYLRECKKAMLFVKEESSNSQNDKMGKPVRPEVYEKWEEGKEIWIKLRKKEFMKGNIPIGKIVEDYKIIEVNQSEENAKLEEFIRGKLHKGEDFSKKHHESVFYDCEKIKKDAIEVKAEYVDLLEKVIQEYQDAKKNRMNIKRKWYSQYKIFPSGTLVYYSKLSDGTVYMSPACIGKEVFTKTMSALLKRNGDYQPCTGKEMCSACQIFGILDKTEKGTYAYGSKIRITDARLINKLEDTSILFEKPMILRELGEPKPSAVEFYTKSPYNMNITQQDGTGYWTYDYKCRKEGCLQPLSEEELKIRGRKFYWHKDVELSECTEKSFNSLNNMKQRIRPMKPCLTPLFTFRVYFEQLNKQQLTQLKWALDFGSPDCAHKIGRARPLGFGSVQVSVNTLYLRNLNAETGKLSLEAVDFHEICTSPIPENEAINTLKIMSNWKKKPKHVNYPQAKNSKGQSKENNSASHQWFNLNKVKSCGFVKVLPEAVEEVSEKKEVQMNKCLYKLEKKPKKYSANRK